ncbi:MAG: selenocysteine-specific translation elongation factor [Mesorhizobium sp.]|nr:MAG: selenocysteine-specific translation elongation factor [Mesorhizobium sp.]RWM29144.1 MAG: selenocysteine-specific translation elongation factor [Mesorhizobium sp.]TIO74311.1 MAG: selenocysteine-specific translation elongation factor [Mesorhizobium sp.]TIO82152.1 MAG: selenocysteine-specific translation elongation factor [Mesorhizobium sp.]TJV49201.1 MAG: selenocysteine-specific translation elongation factor [Mesorhizobium sp.]
MIVGTAGHVDHGKTALVQALTGVDTDRLQEEKARGMTIDLGFAYLPTPSGDVLGFIDVPGHERFVHTMVAGASGIDFVLLVVAADDGVMPQTREHMAIIDLLGVRRGLVVLSKCDLADAARRAAVAADIRSALVGTVLEEAAIIPVSAVTGEGIDDLKGRLFEEALRFDGRSASGRFRLAVDRSFTLHGIGTVVTGTVLSGSVGVGDSVVVSPSGRAARVRSIHAQNRVAERGRAGSRCALNLTGDGVSKEAIRRGDVILDPALHAPTNRIDAELRVLRSERKPIGQWFPVRLHHAATEVGARIVLLGDEPIAPGGTAKVQIVLESPIAAVAGDAYVMRDTSAQRTIGGGRFIDLRAPSRKRRSPERLARLQAYAVPAPDKAVAALLDTPPHYLDLGAFARDRALGADEIARFIDRLGLATISVGETQVVVSSMSWARFKRDLSTILETFHADNPDLPGIGMEKLRLQLDPCLLAPAFAAAMRSLVRAGQIELDGAWIRLPGHEVRLAAREEALWREVEPLIAGPVRFHPPRVRDIAGELGRPEAEIRKLLKLTGRIGTVHEVAHDHFFLRPALAEIVEIVCSLAAEHDGQFSVAQFRDSAGSGRKVAVHILEFLDRHGVTLRRGDLRRINKYRLDLFRREGDNGSPAEDSGGASSPVGRPDFKSGRGREPVLGGFDSHSLPPSS